MLVRFRCPKGTVHDPELRVYANAPAHPLGGHHLARVDLRALRHARINRRQRRCGLRTFVFILHVFGLTRQKRVSGQEK